MSKKIPIWKLLFFDVITAHLVFGAAAYVGRNSIHRIVADGNVGRLVLIYVLYILLVAIFLLHRYRKEL